MNWYVDIRQDEKTLPRQNGEVKLKKSPFQLIFTMPKIASIVHNCALHDGNFQIIIPGRFITYQPADGLIHCMLRGREMAEHPLNKDETIFVTPEDHHFWYYKSPTDHSWSRGYSKGDLTYFERNVSYLYLRESKTKVRIENFFSDRLYMIFLRKTWNDDLIHEDELIKLILNFSPY